MKNRIIKPKHVLVFLTIGVLVFIGIYETFFRINYGSSYSYANKSLSYSFEKQRNFFKAKNLLVIDNLSGSIDSLSSVIKRDGTIEKIYRHEKGKLIEISPTDIKFTDEMQKKLLFDY
ncbi:hypothetical protein CJ739_2079 [Mariniflexile rhizosphaerae]|uniref:hypothetical protein n=1 Tax=unclassified Mariniflexile TaxID=2643887 RepID=UPI000CCA1E33|nr:hypothetical protein [Mariniflexile sp. TRM1-10]AXP81160.1 hypothetical protein CJ739_2079 [Mariniflexile sp. TRM1-10]PLB18310.1 MAG: hypothetical protein TRG1_2873 [Flavobacteriaceae bacterium FS1-H7996/R]